MSLFLGSVQPGVSVDAMEEYFATTFGATVMVHFGPEKTVSGKRYKTANVEVLGRTTEMEKFIAEIERYGYASFMADRVSYTVHLSNRQDRPRNESYTKVVPKIV